VGCEVGEPSWLTRKDSFVREVKTAHPIQIADLAPVFLVEDPVDLYSNWTISPPRHWWSVEPEHGHIVRQAGGGSNGAPAVVP